MSVITNDTLIDMDSIKIDNNYDMVYKNDLSEITITILENSYISIQNLKRSKKQQSYPFFLIKLF